MTKLEELNIDLEIHEASYAKIFDPAYVAYWLKFKKLDVNLLIPSYIKIIKSIKDEIAMIESKKKPKAEPTAKAKKATKTAVKTKKTAKTATKKTAKK
jgi:hypothetical protein